MKFPFQIFIMYNIQLLLEKQAVKNDEKLKDYWQIEKGDRHGDGTWRRHIHI